VNDIGISVASQLKRQPLVAKETSRIVPNREGVFAMDSNLQTNSQDYARGLRAIGQDLADLLPKQLEIEVNGREFIARGQGVDAYSQGQGNDKKATVRKLWNRLVHRHPESDIVEWYLSSIPFVRTYTQEDIKRLDDIGWSQRNAGAGIPEIYSLGERLRTVGRIVDARGGCLVNLFHNLDGVAFQYRDEPGQIHREEHTNDDLYRIQRQFLIGRSAFEPINSRRETALN
jgi:hypothetical protein